MWPNIWFRSPGKFSRVLRESHAGSPNSPAQIFYNPFTCRSHNPGASHAKSMDMNLASPIPVQPENYLEIFMPSRNMFAHHAVPLANSPAYQPQIFGLVNRRRALGGSIALFGLVASTLYASPAAPSAAESSRPAANASPAFPTADLLLREIHYEGKLTDNQAQFTVEIDSESFDKNEAAVALFEGDVAVMPAKLPSGLRIVRAGNQYRLVASKP